MIEEIEYYGIFLLDPAGNIVNWNTGAQNIKGYTRKEIVGKNFEVFNIAVDHKNEIPQVL